MSFPNAPSATHHSQHTPVLPDQAPLRAGAKRLLKLVLVVVLDVTGSMGFAIAAVIRALQKVLDILVAGDFDPAVGLILFRDERIGEMPEVWPVGTLPEELKAVLARTKAEGGGDVPESSLEALQRALRMLHETPEGAARTVLLITDAPPHDTAQGENARKVAQALQDAGAVLFGCTPLIEPYKGFANTSGGQLFELRGDLGVEAFTRVLENVAHTTVRTVRRDLTALDDDVLALLRAARTER